MAKPVSFYSEGTKLAGDLFLPEDLQPGDKRAGIVLCHGYTGVRNLYLPDIARVWNGAGYVVLSFGYKGWGDSEGPPARLAPFSRVADVQAALSFLGYGVQGSDTSLGRLVAEGAAAADSRPWLFYFPGLALLVIVLSISLIGDGIQDAIDPAVTRT